MFDLLKVPHVNLAYAANSFKELTIPCIIEALLNIVLSLIMVFKLGLIGVTIGTILAMLYRLVFQVHFTKRIIGRSQLKFYKEFFLLLIVFILTIKLGNQFIKIDLDTLNAKQWIIYGIEFSVFAFVNYSIIVLLFFRKQMKSIIELYRRKK